MLEKVQNLIKVMKENDVRSIEFFYPNEVGVWMNGAKLLNEFDNVEITPSDAIEGVYRIKVVVGGIVFYGSVNDKELALYQKAKVVA